MYEYDVPKFFRGKLLNFGAYFVEYWLPILRCGFHETRALFCSAKYRWFSGTLLGPLDYLGEKPRVRNEKKEIVQKGPIYPLYF